MATQIAPTPIIKGSEAIKIWKEANKKPSKDVELGVAKLKALFAPKIRKQYMDFVIEKLSEKNLHMIDSFSCIEKAKMN